MRACRNRRRAHTIASLQRKLGFEASGAISAASFKHSPIKIYEFATQTIDNYFGRSGFRICVNRRAFRGSADAPFLRNSCAAPPIPNAYRQAHSRYRNLLQSFYRFFIWAALSFVPAACIISTKIKITITETAITSGRKRW